MVIQKLVFGKVLEINLRNGLNPGFFSFFAKKKINISVGSALLWKIIKIWKEIGKNETLVQFVSNFNSLLHRASFPKYGQGFSQMPYYIFVILSVAGIWAYAFASFVNVKGTAIADIIYF